MLKHTSSLRAPNGVFQERKVDCESSSLSESVEARWRLMSPGGPGGPVVTQGRAVVRRGLSFTLSRSSPRSASFRSEGHETPIPPREEDELLRLPGVCAHIRLPVDSNADSPSLVSTFGRSSSSRSWTSSSSSGSTSSSTSPPTAPAAIKVYAKCLRQDIEYKTVSVPPWATCKEVVFQLLSKYRMRHRDPNLYYLTMEVTARRCSGVPLRSLLVLEENAKPAQLVMCRPPGDFKFSLQMRRGGVVQVHDTVLMPGSQYKSLLISYKTTAEEVVQLLLHCYNRMENRHFYALHEVQQKPLYKDRQVQSFERPLQVKNEWPKDSQEEYVFVLRRNMCQAISLRRLSLRTKGSTTLTEEKLLEEKLKGYDNLIIDCTKAVPIMTKTSKWKENNDAPIHLPTEHSEIKRKSESILKICKNSSVQTELSLQSIKCEKINIDKQLNTTSVTLSTKKKHVYFSEDTKDCSHTDKCKLNCENCFYI